MASRSYMALVEKEGTGYVALCPALDVASQGDTVESTTANLKEAVELFLECADPSEVERRIYAQIFVTRIGTLQSRAVSLATPSNPDTEYDPLS